MFEVFNRLRALVVSTKLGHETVPRDKLCLTFSADGEGFMRGPCVEVQRERRAFQRSKRSNVYRHGSGRYCLVKFLSEFDPTVPKIHLLREFRVPPKF